MTNHTPAEQFMDLEIRIFQRGSHGYPVEITLGGQQRFKRGYLSTDILPWSATGDLGQDGQRLFGTLFADIELQKAWAETRGRSPQRRIRLWIDPDAAELHALPWELLRDGPTMLSAQVDTPFSRYLPIALPWGNPIQEKPIRLLVAIPTPDDLESKGLAPVDLDAERYTLNAVFAEVGQDKLQAHFLDSPVTPSKLSDELNKGYHILHFVGHGVFSSRRGQAALYLQDGAGHADRILDDTLIDMLAGQSKRPRMIFLVACQSATRLTTDAFQGLGPKLGAAGIPAVVAMQDVVTVETARQFSANFYRRLLEHGQVDLAVNQARNALVVAGRSDAGVPVLFMRDKQGVLFQRLAYAEVMQQYDTTPRATPTLTEQPSLEKVLDVYVHDSGKFYHTYQAKLSETLAQNFDSGELEILCDELGTEYQGRSRAAAARNLTNYCNRRGQARFLVETIHRQRPDISWFDPADVDPIKLHQAMTNVYDQFSLTRLGQILSAKYGGSYYQFILYDHLKGRTASDKIRSLIKWHRFDYPNFWDQFIDQVLQEHPSLSDQITFGGVSYNSD